MSVGINASLGLMDPDSFKEQVQIPSTGSKQYCSCKTFTTGSCSGSEFFYVAVLLSLGPDKKKHFNIVIFNTRQVC